MTIALLIGILLAVVFVGWLLTRLEEHILEIHQAAHASAELLAHIDRKLLSLEGTVAELLPDNDEDDL